MMKKGWVFDMTDNNDARLRLKQARDSSTNSAPGAAPAPVVQSTKTQDDHRMGWFAFGVLVPIPGLVVWIANKKAFPSKCESLIKGCICGLVLALVMSGVLFFASSAIGNAASKLMTSAASAMVTAATDRAPMLSMYDNDGVTVVDDEYADLPSGMAISDDGKSIVPVDTIDPTEESEGE